VGAADAILGVIAASMLTFGGVVFTITLVALQLASAQLSPRVLRTFVRSSLTKVEFGLFLATRYPQAPSLSNPRLPASKNRKCQTSSHRL
jgi:uncharacterized membrane protein